MVACVSGAKFGDGRILEHISADADVAWSHELLRTVRHYVGRIVAALTVPGGVQ